MQIPLILTDVQTSSANGHGTARHYKGDNCSQPITLPRPTFYLAGARIRRRSKIVGRGTVNSNHGSQHYFVVGYASKFGHFESASPKYHLAIQQTCAPYLSYIYGPLLSVKLPRETATV